MGNLCPICSQPGILLFFTVDCTNPGCKAYKTPQNAVDELPGLQQALFDSLKDRFQSGFDISVSKDIWFRSFAAKGLEGATLTYILVLDTSICEVCTLTMTVDTSCLLDKNRTLSTITTEVWNLACSMLRNYGVIV